MKTPLIADFPSNMPNCGNCTRKGGACARNEKRYPNGYVKSSVTGDIAGVIYKCVHWTGTIAIAMLLMTTTGNAQTIEQVRAELQRQGVPHANIVLAQARLETGNFTSQQCRIKHNLFGIKHGRRYASYARWQDSITDYKARISSRYHGGDYYAFLRRIGYAKDPAYITKLKRF